MGRCADPNCDCDGRGTVHSAAVVVFEWNVPPGLSPREADRHSYRISQQIDAAIEQLELPEGVERVAMGRGMLAHLTRAVNGLTGLLTTRTAEKARLN